MRVATVGKYNYFNFIDYISLTDNDGNRIGFRVACIGRYISLYLRGLHTQVSSDEDGEHYGVKWVYICRTRSGELRYREDWTEVAANMESAIRKGKF